MKILIVFVTFFGLFFVLHGNENVFATDNIKTTEFQAKTGFLPDISEFKINIEKPKEEINNSLNTAKPLRDSFSQAIEEIKGALEEVKKNRTPDTMEQLHNVFSKNISAIEKKMVGVIKEKDKINDSFEAINREFAKAKVSLEKRLQALSGEIQTNSVKLEELNKRSSELARKYLEQRTDDIKDELYQLKKHIDALTYSNQQAPGQIEGIKRALAMLDQQGKFYNRLGSHVDNLLDKLDVERQKFSSAGEVCSLLLNITVASRGFSEDGTAIE